MYMYYTYSTCETHFVIRCILYCTYCTTHTIGCCCVCYAVHAFLYVLSYTYLTKYTIVYMLYSTYQTTHTTLYIISHCTYQTNSYTRLCVLQYSYVNMRAVLHTLNYTLFTDHAILHCACCTVHIRLHHSVLDLLSYTSVLHMTPLCYHGILDYA